MFYRPRGEKLMTGHAVTFGRFFLSEMKAKRKHGKLASLTQMFYIAL